MYRKRVLPDIVLAALFISGFAAITKRYFANVSHALFVFCLAVIFALVHVALEWRSMIIVTDHEMVYRHRSGHISQVLLDDIARIEETSTTYSRNFRAVPAPAMRLTLRNGSVHTLPIDFPDRNEILAKLRDSVTPSGNTEH